MADFLHWYIFDGKWEERIDGELSIAVHVFFWHLLSWRSFNDGFPPQITFNGGNSSLIKRPSHNVIFLIVSCYIYQVSDWCYYLSHLNIKHIPPLVIKYHTEVIIISFSFSFLRLYLLIKCTIELYRYIVFRTFS